MFKKTLQKIIAPIALVALLLISATPVLAGTSAPTLQTTYSGVHSTSGTTQLSSITIGAGSNQLLVIIGSNSAGSINDPTWNGSSVGMVNVDAVGGGGDILKIWYLKAPTQTTANLTIASTGTGNIQAYLFSGVDQTTPVGVNTNTSANSGTSHSTTFTTDRANSIIVSGIHIEAASASVTANGTNQTLGDFTGGTLFQANSTQTTTSTGSYTQSFTTPSATSPMDSIEVHGITIVDPTVTSVSVPITRNNQANYTIGTITGTGFASGMTVKLKLSGQTDITCTGVTFTNATTLTGGTCAVKGVKAGTWDVNVVNADTGTGTGTGLVKIAEARGTNASVGNAF